MRRMYSNSAKQNALETNENEENKKSDHGKL